MAVAARVTIALEKFVDEKQLDRLNIGGSFAGFHPVDFKDDFLLVGNL